MTCDAATAAYDAEARRAARAAHLVRLLAARFSEMNRRDWRTPYAATTRRMMASTCHGWLR